ncbi:OsmC family protein [Tropicimonas sp. TH_r6]|uniref:OsmC family protein n=1 Tax=Tropicimonas sp. TH_r6 TaxID=3082085 RepID=UPI0029544D28|nr:OsmC family protein [Tropicimonas sp. TH_r6]MDV7145738.1 OsmC family protein [Tropicimonas sp. TH_r6]
MTIALTGPRNPVPQAERDAHVRSCQEKVIQRLSTDPDRAVTTSTMSGTVGDGVACTVTQGRHSAVMDMGPAMGGEERGPSPGFFARAGIVGCVAIALKLAAAREGLTFRSVDIDLETTSDDLAIFGLGGGRAAPLETRITIHIDTDEPDDSVSDLIERVLEMDTWFLALRDPQNVSVAWQTGSD